MIHDGCAYEWRNRATDVLHRVICDESVHTDSCFVLYDLAVRV